MTNLRRTPALLAGAALVLVVIVAALLAVSLRSGAPDAAAFDGAAAARAGDVRVAAFFDPDPPRQRGNTAWLRLTRGGEPVAQADVGVEAMMPEMGAMPEMRSRALVTPHGDGVYSAAFDLEMGGGWTLEVTVDGRMAALQFTVGTRGLVGEEGSTAPGGPVEVVLEPVDLDAATLERLRGAVALTDDIRLRLATDTLDGVAALASDVSARLRAPAPDPLAAWLEVARDGAEGLRRAETLDEARRAYGELMRGVVAVASANERLREGLHVYACPMAEGFQKWVQTREGLHNPYMGHAMPGCGTDGDWSSEGPVPGVHEDAGVTIEPARQQRFGIRSQRVRRSTVVKTVRGLGRVSWADTEVKDVTLTTGGWVRALHVDAEGRQVARGEALFDVYSPDLYAAQREFLLALSRPADDPLREASRRKLVLMGLTPGQIDALARRGEPWEQVPILSPVAGYVVSKQVVQGSAFQPGAPLFRIAPLGRVWVEAEVYAEDLPLVEVGMPATVRLPGRSDAVYPGAVAQLLPTVSPVQHTRTVRLVLDNPDERLLPGMYADVALEAHLPARLVVPETAVIHTGARHLVFVDQGHGRLVPRDVELGEHAAEGWVVTRGLSDGEAVVTTGTFLVAAESRMRAATDLWEIR